METQQQPSQTPKPSAQNFLKQIEEFLNTYLHVKAPFHLPPNAKEFIVQYGPWITVVMLALSLPLLLGILGVSLLVSPIAVMVSPYHNATYLAHWVLTLATFALELAALPGLFKRSLKSWYLVYYAGLVSALSSLISFDIFGLIIGTAITMFILFEIKEYYK